MTALQIESVSPPPEMPSELWGSHIEQPKAGDERDVSELRILGWVLGRRSRALAVEIVYGDHVVQAVPARNPRPDVALAYPHVPEADNCGFRAHVAVHELETEFELCLKAILRDGSRVPIGSIQARCKPFHSEAQTPVSDRRSDESQIPSIKQDLRRLIDKAIKGTETTDSATGSSIPNRSGSWPSDPEAGLSTWEANVLDELVLAGMKVLDIGAANGDRSRAARTRGAALVDGLEPDPGLVKVARLLNACHQVTRVSFYQRDVTLAGTYTEHYDVVLALSSLAVVRPVLDSIASVTDGVFVGQLPEALNDASALESDSRSHLLEEIERCFPFRGTLHPSDDHDSADSRPYVLICAKTRGALDAALRAQSGAAPSYSGRMPPTRFREPSGK